MRNDIKKAFLLKIKYNQFFYVIFAFKIASF
jgi:hypothetical protein